MQGAQVAAMGEFWLAMGLFVAFGFLSGDLSGKGRKARHGANFAALAMGKKKAVTNYGGGFGILGAVFISALR